ncbi:MAG: alpha/beta fold hydrolase, partial [Acidimicrobiales bacterium]
MDDEFSLLEENATEVGLAWTGRPAVSRRDVDLPDGRVLSALVWGEGEPELVLLHGGAQNAHTWDTVALALARPLVALDLAGHGRSSWREDGRYTPTEMADDVAVALGVLAPRSPAVVGMSMGGITTIALAAHHAALVPRAVLVDVTPGVNAEKAAAIMAFVSGPPTFPSFQALLDRTVEHNPTR